MSTKKHSGKRKSSIPSDRPRNNTEREGLKYAKTPSMYGYIKLPVGCPTKTIDPSPPSVNTAITPVTAAAARLASSVKVNMLCVTSMLLDNDRKIANEAMFKADPQAVVPQQTLNSLLISAKAKINGVTSGDLGSGYDVYNGRVGVKNLVRLLFSQRKKTKVVIVHCKVEG